MPEYDRQENQPDVTQVPAVTVYWRPHCPFCVRLRWQLRRSRLPVQEINIWKDAAAAARVREITGGDETVPTVTVGPASLVNPTRAQVLAAVREHVASPGPGPVVTLRDRRPASRAGRLRGFRRLGPRRASLSPNRGGPRPPG